MVAQLHGDRLGLNQRLAAFTDSRTDPNPIHAGVTNGT
jgi:hypothetical protein